MLISIGIGPGEGHFNFVCMGVCGHRIGNLTKAGPSINKNTPILRLFTTEIDSPTKGFIQFKRKPPDFHVKLYQNYDPSAGFWSEIYTHPQVLAWKTHPLWPHITNMTQYDIWPNMIFVSLAKFFNKNSKLWSSIANVCMSYTETWNF